MMKSTLTHKLMDHGLVYGYLMMLRMVALTSFQYQWNIYGGLMALTLEELKERLKQLDEVLILELLQLESDDLVNRFEDLVEKNFSDLEVQLEDRVYE